MREPTLKGLLLSLGICLGMGICAGAQPAGGPATQAAAPKVSVLSLRVLWEVDPTALSALTDSYSGDFKKGIQLVGRVTLPAGDVVSVDKGLKVDKFADNKGTDLGNGAVEGRFPSDENTQCYMSPDRKQCTFWIGSSILPAAGAEKLVVQGTLGLQIGVGEKAAESKKLPLKLGQEFEVGDLNLKLREMSVEQGGMFLVGFSSLTDLGPVKAVECTDQDGKAVAVQINERQRGIGALQIALTRPVKEMTLRVVQYEKIENLKLPVNLEVKVGL